MKTLLTLLITCFFVSFGIAQEAMPEAFTMEHDTSVFRLDTIHYQILEDVAGKYSLEDVQNTPIANGFHHDSYFNSERRAGTYWLRMIIKNNLGYDKTVWMFFNFGSFFDMYIIKPSGNIEKLSSGELLPYSQITGQNGDKARFRIPFTIEEDQELVIYERLQSAPWQQSFYTIMPSMETDEYRKEMLFEEYRVNEDWKDFIYSGIMIGILILAACYNLLTYFSIRDNVYLYFGLCLLFFILDRHGNSLNATLFREYPYYFSFFSLFFRVLFFYCFVQFIKKFLQKDNTFKKLHYCINIFMGIVIFISLLNINVRYYSMGFITYLDFFNTLFTRLTYLLVFVLNYKMWKIKHPYSHFSLIAITPIFIYWLITLLFFLVSFITQQELTNVPWKLMPYVENACLTWLIIVFSATLVSRFNKMQKQVVTQEFENQRLAREREIERTKLIESQKELLEKQVTERTIELQNSLESLHAAQNQLVQKEKLASLGELTAGIAHEIQNPLNFVNNFSELSVGLVKDLKEELERPEKDEAYIDELFGDLSQNQEKINHHGKRASNIVKGMLEHSRTSTGVKELTDINALADEYLRLSYHGLRAKDKDFNANFELIADENLPKIEVIPQDIGRVLLNLINNAFYAVNQRAQLSKGLKPLESSETYTPSVFVTTQHLGNQIIIKVKDNGTGMPESVRAKVFQPFFTTKPTGSGTGLGLSLAYDIVTKGHGGSLEVESTEGEGTTFIISQKVSDISLSK